MNAPHLYQKVRNNFFKRVSMKNRNDQYKPGITSESATEKRTEAHVRLRKDRSAKMLADARRELAMAKITPKGTGMTDIEEMRAACISIQNILGSPAPTEDDLVRACAQLCRLFAVCSMSPHVPGYAAAQQVIVETKMPPFDMVVERLMKLIYVSATTPAVVEPAVHALHLACQLIEYGNERVKETGILRVISNTVFVECIITHLAKNTNDAVKMQMIQLLAVCCGHEASHQADLFILSSYSRSLHDAFCMAWIHFLKKQHVHGLYVCTWLAQCLFWHHSESSLTINMLTATLWGLVTKMMSEVDMAVLSGDETKRQIVIDLTHCVAAMAGRGSAGTDIVLADPQLMETVFQIFTSEIYPKEMQHPIVEIYFHISRDRTAFEQVLVPHRAFPLIVDEMHKRCAVSHDQTALLGWTFFYHLAAIGTRAVRMMLEKYVLHTAAKALIAADGNTARIVTECCRVLYRCVETLDVHGELKQALPIMQQRGLDLVRAFGTQLSLQCEEQRAGICIRGLSMYCDAVPKQQRPVMRQILRELPDLEDAVNIYYHRCEASLSIPATELLDNLRSMEMDEDDEEYEMKSEFKF